MPLQTLVTAALAFVLGTLVGCWPLTWWAQRNMRYDRMLPGTIRIIATVGTSVGFAVVLLRLGPVPVVLPVLAFTAAAVVLAIVDLAEKRLPNAVLGPAIVAIAVLLVVAAALGGQWPALIWALAGCAAMFAFYLILALVAPSSVGLGDVKLGAAIGMLLGWFGIGAWLAALVAAFVIGGIVALIALALRRVTLRGSIPFGPSMLAGALLTVLLVGA